MGGLWAVTVIVLSWQCLSGGQELSRMTDTSMPASRRRWPVAGESRHRMPNVRTRVGDREDEGGGARAPKTPLEPHHIHISFIPSDDGLTKKKNTFRLKDRTKIS